jgi:uncharacterized membrane protein YgcG
VIKHSPLSLLSGNVTFFSLWLSDFQTRVLRKHPTLQVTCFSAQQIDDGVEFVSPTNTNSDNDGRPSSGGGFPFPGGFFGGGGSDGGDFGDEVGIPVIIIRTIPFGGGGHGQHGRLPGMED